MKITWITDLVAHPGVGKNLRFVKIDTEERISEPCQSEKCC